MPGLSNLNQILAFSDIDHTIVPQFTLFPVCDALAAEGVIAAGDNERIQDTKAAFESGEIDYTTFVIGSLLAAASAAKGKRTSVARLIAGRYIEEELQLFPWVSPTFEDIDARKGQLTIVSAEPDFITEPVAALFGADYFSTQLHVNSDGTYSGAVESVLSSSQKGVLVQARIQEASTSGIYVFGDSSGDIGMLDLARPIKHAYCIMPDDELRQHAASTGMTIVEDPNIARSLLKEQAH